MQKLLTAIFVATVMTLAPLAPAVSAESPEFKAGVKAFNEHQYAQAMGFFMQAGGTDPDNPEIHLYLGRSYEGVNQPTLAKQEYVYVLKSNAKPAIKQQANTALYNLVHETMGTKSGGSPTRLATTPPKSKGKMHILFFTADW